MKTIFKTSILKCTGYHQHCRQNYSDEMLQKDLLSLTPSRQTKSKFVLSPQKIPFVISYCIAHNVADDIKQLNSPADFDKRSSKENKVICENRKGYLHWKMAVYVNLRRII